MNMSHKEIIEREKKFLIQFYKRFNVIFVKGRGCWLYDLNGKKYLDMVAGIAVMSIGHGHPYFLKKVAEQLQNLVHVSNLYYTIPQIKLAEKLKSISGMDKFFFCNSGTEAVEAALKISRKFTKRKKFIAFERGFHGRTLGSLSITYKEKFRKPFEPLLRDVVFAKFNDLEDIQNKIDHEVAAVILEPVQGEAGVYPASKEFIKTIFELKERFNFLVIFDEVQTGFGRTGEWFAKDYFKVTPDIIAMAKAMGGGIPIGCVGVREEIANKMVASEHASTFGGNPLACVASLATIEIIENEKLVDNSRKMGKYLKNQLKKINLKSVRGLGLMIGASTHNAKNVVLNALERGLLINNTSEKDLRFVPPLIIKKNEIEYAIGILKTLVS